MTNRTLIIAFVISLLIHSIVLISVKSNEKLVMRKNKVGEMSISIGTIEKKEPQLSNKVSDSQVTDDGTSEKIKNSYLTKIRQRIAQYKKYPTIAKTRSWEGSPKVEFLVLKNGSISQLKLASRSTHDILNQEALSTVKRAAPFLPIPKELNISKIEVSLSLTYKLD